MKIHLKLTASLVLPALLLTSCGLSPTAPNPPPAPTPTADPIINLANALRFAVEAAEALAPRIGNLTPEQAGALRANIAVIGLAAVDTVAEVPSADNPREKFVKITGIWSKAILDPAFIAALPEETGRFVRRASEAVALVLTAVQAIYGQLGVRRLQATPVISAEQATHLEQISKRGQKLANHK